MHWATELNFKSSLFTESTVTQNFPYFVLSSCKSIDNDIERAFYLYTKLGHEVSKIIHKSRINKPESSEVMRPLGSVSRSTMFWTRPYDDARPSPLIHWVGGWAHPARFDNLNPKITKCVWGGWLNEWNSAQGDILNKTSVLHRVGIYLYV